MTLDEIKTKWAKDHSYNNYFEFLDLTRKCDTDHVFIMDGAVTQIAKRYAQSQTQELIEKNRELIEVLSWLIKSNSLSVYDRNKITEILTKYNHLK